MDVDGKWKVDDILYHFGWFSLLRSYKESLIYRYDDSWNKVGFLLYHHDVSHVVLSFPSWTQQPLHATKRVTHWFSAQGFDGASAEWLGDLDENTNHITWLYERWCNGLAPNFLSCGDCIGPFCESKLKKINTIQYLDTGRVSRVIGSKVPFFEVPFKHLRKPFTFQSSFEKFMFKTPHISCVLLPTDCSGWCNYLTHA